MRESKAITAPSGGCGNNSKAGRLNLERATVDHPNAGTEMEKPFLEKGFSGKHARQEIQPAAELERRTTP
jgi:hypothetical protein